MARKPSPVAGWKAFQKEVGAKEDGAWGHKTATALLATAQADATRAADALAEKVEEKGKRGFMESVAKEVGRNTTKVIAMSRQAMLQWIGIVAAIVLAVAGLMR